MPVMPRAPPALGSTSTAAFAHHPSAGIADRSRFPHGITSSQGPPPAANKTAAVADSAQRRANSCRSVPALTLPGLNDPFPVSRGQEAAAPSEGPSEFMTQSSIIDTEGASSSFCPSSMAAAQAGPNPWESFDSGDSPPPYSEDGTSQLGRRSSAVSDDSDFVCGGLEVGRRGNVVGTQTVEGMCHGRIPTPARAPSSLGETSREDVSGGGLIRDAAASILGGARRRRLHSIIGCTGVPHVDSEAPSVDGSLASSPRSSSGPLPSTIPSTASSTAPNTARETATRGRIKELVYPVLPGIQGDRVKAALSQERLSSCTDRRAMAPLLSRAVSTEIRELERAWGAGAQRSAAEGNKRRLETLVVESLKRLCVKPVRLCTQKALMPDFGLEGSSADAEARCARLEAELAAREQRIRSLKDDEAAHSEPSLAINAGVSELAQRLAADGDGAEASGGGGGARAREVLGLLERTLQRSIVVEDFVRESAEKLCKARVATEERERAVSKTAWTHLPAGRPDALLSLARMP